MRGAQPGIDPAHAVTLDGRIGRRRGLPTHHHHVLESERIRNTDGLAQILRLGGKLRRRDRERIVLADCESQLVAMKPTRDDTRGPSYRDLTASLSLNLRTLA